jgi:hypothetical protein
MPRLGVGLLQRLLSELTAMKAKGGAMRKPKKRIPRETAATAQAASSGRSSKRRAGSTPGRNENPVLTLRKPLQNAPVDRPYMRPVIRPLKPMHPASGKLIPNPDPYFLDITPIYIRSDRRRVSL